jgi:hypothetical protein
MSVCLNKERLPGDRTQDDEAKTVPEKTMGRTRFSTQAAM